jgi:hypothetical protein
MRWSGGPANDGRVAGQEIRVRGYVAGRVNVGGRGGCGDEGTIRYR